MSTELAPPLSVERSRKVRSWVILIITALISLICMASVLSGAALTHIWGEVRHMHWKWVGLAVVADIMVYLLHGWRWKILLTPIESIPFASTVQAIYVGLFANEVLPLRAGELIRCFLLAQTTEIPLSVTFASALIERLFDGVWLMAFFLASLHMGHMPLALRRSGYLLGVLILILAAVLAYAMYSKKQSIDRIFGMAWPRWFDTLIDDLHLIGHSRYLYYSFLISGAYLGAQMVPIYMLVRANALNVPWTASFTMMVLLRLSSIIPQAPGNLGLYQWVASRILIMFKLEAAHAKRFSLILWAVMTIPLMVIGLIAVLLEGINLTHLHKQATAAASDRKKT